MKNIIKFGCILMFAMSSKAQTIVPVEKTIDYVHAGNGIPDNTYLKDVNNLLSKYVGTWKGTYGNKNYTIIITKSKIDFLGISADKLLMRYLVTSSNGTILEDTRKLPNSDAYVIEGRYFGKGAAYYALMYEGKNSECGDVGTIHLRMKDATNKQMSLTFEPDKIMRSEDTCPGMKSAAFTFPRDGMRITKQ